MLASLVALTLLAAEPSPLEVVKSGYTDVQQTARAPGATIEQLATAVDRFVDFEELARRALGETWDTLTPAQRKDFTRAMRGMLRAFYAQRTLGLGHAEVEYGQQTIDGDDARVSTVVTVDGTRVPIDYRLYKLTRKPGGWRIYDIVTNQMSQLENYRTQFRQLLDRGGFDELLSTLKMRAAQVERDAGQFGNGTGSGKKTRTWKRP